ncbi:MAG: carboxypeptidase regulatory-like domain-containing protein [Gemmatimonadetes bacterium]|nr:carboxypeptidase regulatory-like domain-containing protein [Gemmatimonadota bacterium]
MKLTGMSEDETTTSATGAYSFTGLRAGVHTVEISGFDNEDIGFSATSAVAEVAVGATEELDFQASYLRASAVMGQVTIEGKGLAGVTVSLQGVDRNLEVQLLGPSQGRVLARDFALRPRRVRLRSDFADPYGRLRRDRVRGLRRNRASHGGSKRRGNDRAHRP